ncbi:universal stress protein [Granulosicoccus antarcticus]|uniref:Universal stress protein n=1 Tax=Granulosicoccus antarcticus IMCC3135 TaxID=1192854 RepID=A0A2Z2NRH9_9GAMM|nr:universal stress protein [Granulosicoccus antarcticus]ASJ74116.1 TRAP-T-associated universal stress protein TeaD [Granulosicoccus antarcticus IMCC3135]
MRTSTSRILFTTDLSKNSTYALHHAVSLAKSTGARLHILHVAEPMSEDARITMRLFFQDEAARETALRTRGEYIKAELDERQTAFWPTVAEENQSVRAQIDSIDVVEGHPAEVILRRSRELDCDLIVLGAHSHGFSQTFLGSVAKRVLRRATIPTLVVPYRPE